MNEWDGIIIIIIHDVNGNGPRRVSSFLIPNSTHDDDNTSNESETETKKLACNRWQCAHWYQRLRSEHTGGGGGVVTVVVRARIINFVEDWSQRQGHSLYTNERFTRRTRDVWLQLKCDDLFLCGHEKIFRVARCVVHVCGERWTSLMKLSTCLILCRPCAFDGGTSIHFSFGLWQATMIHRLPNMTCVLVCLADCLHTTINFNCCVRHRTSRIWKKMCHP